MFHVCFFKMLQHFCELMFLIARIFCGFEKLGREKHNKISTKFQLKARGYQPPCLVNLGTLGLNVLGLCWLRCQRDVLLSLLLQGPRILTSSHLVTSHPPMPG